MNNYLRRIEKSGSLSTELYKKKLKQLEVDEEFYMDFVKYVKLLLMFAHHLDL